MHQQHVALPSAKYRQLQTKLLQIQNRVRALRLDEVTADMLTAIEAALSPKVTP